MPKIMHAADFHIGAGFEFLPPEKSKQAKDMQLTQLSDFINRAGDIGADAVLIAGDLFDTPEVQASLAAEVFSILSKCLCPVLISPGNHDYYWSKSPYYSLTLPPNLHIFTERTLSPFPLDDGQTIIWGAAFQGMKASIDLKAPLDNAFINLCLVHGKINGDSGYNPITPEAAAESGFDYIALGHNHTFSGLQKAGSVYYACPGCFTPATLRETGEKGYLSGTVTKDDVELTLVSARALEFSEMHLPMDDISSDEQLEAELRKLIPPTHSRVCCTLKLTGNRYYSPNLEGLKAALEHVFFHSFLRDETEEPVDLWRYIENDDIRGEVSRSLKEKIMKVSTKEEIEKLKLALRYALWALDGQTPNL